MTKNKIGKTIQNAKVGVKSLLVILDGYIEQQTDDRQTYLVPMFMVEDFEGKKEAHDKKIQLQLLKSSTGVSSALGMHHNSYHAYSS